MDLDGEYRGGLFFVQTCGACPEQYDVYKGKNQVGYVRLRSGAFRVDAPDCGGATVLSEDYGDGLCGSFSSQDRAPALERAASALTKYHRQQWSD